MAVITVLAQFEKHLLALSSHDDQQVLPASDVEGVVTWRSLDPELTALASYELTKPMLENLRLWKSQFSKLKLHGRAVFHRFQLLCVRWADVVGISGRINRNGQGFEGDRVPLQFLLLVSAGISLMIGAAITDRQLAFEAVKRSEENLEQQVHDRTAELREAYEFQQHLIRSIGHDLRQPVQSINMMMQGLVREHKGTASAARLAQARDISETAGGFITRVLDYAKRDAGKVELLAERFAIQRVFDQIQHTFGPHAEAEGIQLKIQGTHLELTSDAHLLWEALSNLVQNAIRLSARGEVVKVQAMEADDALVITVADQVTTGTNLNGQAGFGLDIVKQIALLLDAQFELQPNRAELRFSKQVHPEA